MGEHSDMGEPDGDERIGSNYEQVRLRLDGLLTDLEPAEWELDVAACPGWRVRDVLAHLVGTIEDAAAGRLSGPPDEAMTAEQVQRHLEHEPVVLLEQWRAMAPMFAAAVSQRSAWPAMFDVVSHEHDIRSAVGRSGARDSETVQLAARLLARGVRAPRPVSFRLDDEVVVSRGDGPAIELRASSFEVLRLRLGRRSADQVRQLDWSEDPAPVLDSLFVFGPATQPLRE